MFMQFFCASRLWKNYQKSLIGSIFCSKYFYKNIFQVVKVKNLVIATKMNALNSFGLVKTQGLLLFFFLYLISSRQPFCFFTLKRRGYAVSQRYFTFYSLLSSKTGLWAYLYKTKKLLKGIKMFSGFYVKQNINKLIYKFSEKENFLHFFYYYKFRKIKQIFISYTYSDFLSFFFKSIFFLFFLNFTEKAFKQKYLYFLSFFKQPFLF